MSKQNFFPTLKESLESEGLVEKWPLGSNINYGDTVRHIIDNTLISVYRDERGMYERPIHYSIK